VAIAVLLTAVLTVIVGWKAGRHMQRMIGSRSSYQATKALVPTMRKAHYRTIPRAMGYLVLIIAGMIALLAVVVGVNLPRRPSSITPAELPTAQVTSHSAKPGLTPRWPHFDPHKTAPPFVRSTH
jgi:amino acid transporter